MPTETLLMAIEDLSRSLVPLIPLLYQVWSEIQVGATALGPRAIAVAVD
jgi:hypothetical protein